MEAKNLPNLTGVQLWAWMGEDEYGSGDVGLKQADTPAGLIPLAAVAREKIDRTYLIAQLQEQVDHFQKTIVLVECAVVKVVKVIQPRGKG